MSQGARCLSMRTEYEASRLDKKGKKKERGTERIGEGVAMVWFWNLVMGQTDGAPGRGSDFPPPAKTYDLIESHFPTNRPGHHLRTPRSRRFSCLPDCQETSFPSCRALHRASHRRRPVTCCSLLHHHLSPGPRQADRYPIPGASSCSLPAARGPGAGREEKRARG